MVFLYSSWINLPLSTRARIAEQFGFKKIGSTHVQDNRIISDGYQVKDIELALTKEALEAYLGVEYTFPDVMWELLIKKIEAPEAPLRPEIAPPQVVEEVKKELNRRMGRPKGSRNKKHGKNKD